MSVKLSTGCAKKMLDTGSLRSLLQLGFLDIYTGAQPSSPNDAATGTKLVTLTANGDGSTGLSFEASAVANTLSKLSSQTWAGTVAATGVAGYFRFREAADAGTSLSTTAVRIDGTIATSGADMNLATTSLTSGSTFTLSSGSITIPLA